MKPKDTNPPSSLGALIDYDCELRERIRVLTKQADDLKTERDQIELQILEMMDAQGVTQTRGAKATASVSESVVAHVKDWDRFWGYIGRTKQFHLLERRPANAAFRELLTQRNGKEIPGAEPFTKRSINLRTL
jgi:hypothetical protein